MTFLMAPMVLLDSQTNDLVTEMVRHLDDLAYENETYL